MNKLYIMIGAPGSGKTTWCKKNVPKEAVYISRDEIRFNMLEENDDYFSKEDSVYTEFIRQISEALAAGFDVYADQTSLDKAARSKLIRSLYAKPEEINAIWIKRPLKVVLEYNKKRSGRALVPDHIVRQMWYRTERPTAAEGIDNLEIIEENSCTHINLKEA